VLGTFTAVISLWVTNRTKKAIQGMMILPLIVPEVALGVSLLFFFNALRLPFGILTLVLSHSLFCVPYVYIMVRLRLQEIDVSIIESALDLGGQPAADGQDHHSPPGCPVHCHRSAAVLAMSLDDVIISTYMSGPRSTTLPVHIFSMMRVGVTPKSQCPLQLDSDGNILDYWIQSTHYQEEEVFLVNRRSAVLLVAVVLVLAAAGAAGAQEGGDHPHDLGRRFHPPGRSSRSSNRKRASEFITKKHPPTKTCSPCWKPIPII